MALSRVASLTDFAALAPPWMLSQLDQNTTNIAAAFNDASLGYVNAIATDTGTANNYAVTCVYGTPSAYNAGFTIAFIPANTNTGASVITVSPLGSLSIVDVNGNTLQAGAIQSGRLCALICMGSSFRIVNLLQSGGVPYSYDYDDFLGNPKFLLPLASGGSSSILTTFESGHPGNWALTSGTGYGLLYGSPLFLDAFTFKLRSICGPGTIATAGQFHFGFNATASMGISSGQQRVGFYGLQGTTNWQASCNAGGATPTTVNTGVALSTNTYYDLEIVVSTSAATFFINGTQVASITTQIPINSQVLYPYFLCIASGSSSSLVIDTCEILCTGVPQLGTNQRFLLGCI